MSIVAGIDFGTQGVRVCIVDSEQGVLGFGTASYPLIRLPHDVNHASQKHDDHLRGLVEAMASALTAAGVSGSEIEALAIDTTGSTIVPVNERLEPLDDYYLWCDHRAWLEADHINEAARERQLAALDWSGGMYLSEFAFAKLLHWLRHNPDKRSEFATALEHCDMITATLCGVHALDQIPRSVCAMGHKWLWNASLGGFPDNEFFRSVDPLLDGIAEKLPGRFEKSNQIAGHLCDAWASKLGLNAGIPIPVPALDAHWDAIGAGIRLGDIVNVIGTSTCVMALSQQAKAIPGVCGVVDGSIHPELVGIEAGLSAAGDLFDAIARRSNVPTGELFGRIEGYRNGQTGLLRVPWDNGDRTVLGNPHLRGVTLGWNLLHQPEDELFAAVEGTAFQTRIIIERMQAYGAPVDSVINAGGIPRKSQILNQVYANVFNRPVQISTGDTTGLGAAIFAFMAIDAFGSVEDAQDQLCPAMRTIEPIASQAAVAQELFEQFKAVYFELGGMATDKSSVAKAISELHKLSGI